VISQHQRTCGRGMEAYESIPFTPPCARVPLQPNGAQGPKASVLLPQLHLRGGERQPSYVQLGGSQGHRRCRLVCLQQGHTQVCVCACVLYSLCTGDGSPSPPTCLLRLATPSSPALPSLPPPPPLSVAGPAPSRGRLRSAIMAFSRASASTAAEGVESGTDGMAPGPPSASTRCLF
jgi:hypothetical protein